MRISDWVKNYRKEHGLSMQAFGNLCGLSKAYISILEKDINPTTGKSFVPTLQTLKKIADATNTDLDLLFSLLDGSQEIEVNSSDTTHNSRMFSMSYKRPESDSKNSGIGHVSGGVRIPILGKVVAGIPLEAITDIDGWEEISPKMAASGEYFALRIKGLSMEPKLHEGDIVIVKRQSDVESGDTAIILVDGEDATVKQIKKNKEGIMLIGLNIYVYPPHFYTNREIADLPVQIIGKVVESRHTW